LWASIGKHLGVTFNKPKIDIDAVRKNKDDIVSKLTGGIKALAKARGVQVVTGYGRFISNTQIKIDATNEVIEFEQAIIAAGKPQSSTFTPAFSQSMSLPLGVRPIETKTLSKLSNSGTFLPLKPT
jgi:dihydrolipoamide dehydrogenase